MYPQAPCTSKSHNAHPNKQHTTIVKWFKEEELLTQGSMNMDRALGILGQALLRFWGFSTGVLLVTGEPEPKLANVHCLFLA